ncbi:TonB-dependent receptor [Henriciella sp. AS95]|uniref:TonB-dependent receptor n=1 Tax=Henriciella sp. AS95 TaxID=3135782 RepID=UPI00317669FF
MRMIYVVAAALTALPATAQDDPNNNRLDSVTVHGRGLELIGEAGAASEGVVGYADFEDRPISRAGELVEVIPGIVATQHSGEGKANQYFLRGFNLDHGSDFAISVDGVPINMRTHGHGQGYLDLNSFIPEVIERVDYRKGPYFPSNGDFSVAASARYTTYDTLDENFIEAKIGENEYYRLVGGYSTALSATTNLLLAGEYQTYDGPWDVPQNLEKLSGLAKISGQKGDLHYEVSLTGYDNAWDSSDQIPLRAVQSGLIDRFGSIDDSLGGSTSRYSLSSEVEYDHASGATTTASAYAVSYDFSLWSNFTYFLEDPVNGDQIKQTDDRTYYGGRLTHTIPASENLDLTLGAETRFDDIKEVGLFNTVERQPINTVRLDSVEEFSVGIWGQADYQFTPSLRGTVGLRGDYLDADVTALSLPINSGEADDTLLSPSAALAWRANDNIELYANYGEGFHSNDVRGATIQIDPATGGPADTVPLFSKAKGAELGARFETGDLKTTIALFHLELDSELVFVGDAGTTEVNDATVRNGVEATAFWRPNDWFVGDLAVSVTDGRFDIPGSDDKIPNSIETVLSGGALFRFDPLTLSARLRHFGESPLIEDGSAYSDPTTIVNLGATYDWQQITFGLEVLNAFDAEDSDITYFFESQLRGEASPVEDIHFKPVEPRQIRASIRYRF